LIAGVACDTVRYRRLDAAQQTLAGIGRFLELRTISMLTARAAYLAAVSFFITTSAVAQGLQDDPTSDAIDMSCFDETLPADVRLLCDGLGDSLALMMDQPASFAVVTSPRAARPSLARRQITPEVTARGLGSPQTSWPSLPQPPADRGIGFRLKAADAPFSLASEMVLPGGAAAAHLYWSLTADRGASAKETGLFWGGAANGAYLRPGASESLSGYAGLRRVVHPRENWRMGAEITPRVSVHDIATLSSSVAIEPRLTSRLDLPGQHYSASVNVDLGYRMPVGSDDEASSYGRLKLTIRAR
jgi:hypothetical protein